MLYQKDAYSSIKTTNRVTLLSISGIAKQLLPILKQLPDYPYLAARRLRRFTSGAFTNGNTIRGAKQVSHMDKQAAMWRMCTRITSTCCNRVVCGSLGM